MKMNSGLLGLILMVKAYKELKMNERMFYGSEIDTYKETEKYYYDIEDKFLNEFDLKKNITSFEKVYYFTVTKEMMQSDFDKLYQFNF